MNTTDNGKACEAEINHTNNAKGAMEQSDQVQHIPVHFPKSRCHPNNFQGSDRRRVSRFYIGGIRKSSTYEDMKSYLQERDVRVTFIRFFQRQNRSTSAAQLNVDAADESLVSDPKFWPQGIFVKRWLPWEVFKSEVAERQNQYYNNDR